MENNLERIMGLLARADGLLSVLMVDVDFFKKYNDTYGHEQGDVCLRLVAQALNSSITRTEDFAARYGGEEFAAILPNTGEEGARMIAERLVENVRKLNLPHANSAAAGFVTVSVGVTTGRVAFTHTWEDFLKAADDALYTSKQNGRNQYTCLEFKA
jgi:diguanylate cyclase (GGDEF)-like protein